MDLGIERPEALWLLLPAFAALALLEARLPAPPRRRAVRTLLRAALLSCLVLAIAGPTAGRRVDEPGRLVVVSDASVRGDLARRDAAAASAEALAAAGAAGAVHGPPIESGSDAAEAVAEARLAFGPGEVGTVLLLTTGRGDLRGLAPAEAAARAAGVEVEVTTVPRGTADGRPGPRVVEVRGPSAEASGPFAVRALVESEQDLAAVLLVDGVVAARRDVPGRGAREVSFDGVEAGPGVHEVAVAVRPVDPTDGAASPEAVGRSVVRVGAPPRILIVTADTPGDPVRRALSAQGLAVAAVPPRAVEEVLAGAPPGPEAVAIDAASVGALPPEVASRLLARVEAGLGLFVASGADPVPWEALARSPLAAALPLAPLPRPPEPPPPPEPEPEPPPEEPPPDPSPEPDEGPGLSAEQRPEDALPITLLFVLDRSGSMEGVKLAMAIEAAQRAAATLSRKDRVGVITFAGDARVDVPPAELSALPGLALQLATVKADGDTNIYGALRLAFEVMRGETNPIRHVLLLTDGHQTHDASFGGLIRQMRDASITLTAVGLGPEHDYAILKNMAYWAWPGGRYEMAEGPRDLPTILTRDTGLVAEKRAAQARARLPDPSRPPEPRRAPPPRRPEPPPPRTPPTPAAAPAPAEARRPLRVLRPHEATRGLEPSAMPSVEEPLRSEPRPDAAVLLAREDGPAVLAARRQGLGRVVEWALPWDDPGLSAWAELGRVLAQSVRSVVAPRGPAETSLRARVVPSATGDALEVEASEADPSVEWTLEWVGPEGSRPVGRVSPGRATEVPLPAVAAPAVATIRAVPSDGSPPTTITYLAGAGLPPPDAPGDAARVAALRGRPAAEPAAIGAAVRGATRTHRTSLALLFLLAAAVLLPLDVAAHRRTSAR